MTTGDFQPMLQLGLPTVAMLLAGLAKLLQRRPEPVLDWPPSPPPPKHVRRDLIVVSTAVLQVVASNRGPGTG